MTRYGWMAFILFCALMLVSVLVVGCWLISLTSDKWIVWTLSTISATCFQAALGILMFKIVGD